MKFLNVCLHFYPSESPTNNRWLISDFLQTLGEVVPKIFKMVRLEKARPNVNRSFKTICNTKESAIRQITVH